MSGFDGFYLRMAELAARVPEAGKLMVLAGLNPVYEKANELVPVDTGALKASGRITEPVISGNVISAAVAYGNQEEVNYAVYQEFGTRKMSAQPYLTPATLESVDEIPALEAAAFQEAMAGV